MEVENWKASIASINEPIHIYEPVSGNVLAHITTENCVWSPKNAHLMSAAPELYKALRALHEMILAGTLVESDKSNNRDAIKATLDADMALARAIGIVADGTSKDLSGDQQ